MTQIGAAVPQRTGGESLSYSSATLPTLNLTIVRVGAVLRRYIASFRVGYPLGQPEFNCAKDLLREVFQKEPPPDIWSFVKTSIERPIREKPDPSNPYLLADSSYFTRAAGDWIVRAGKHSGDPTLIVERPSGK